MDKFPHKIALIIALISFIISLAINISIFTGIIRSIIVYIGVLFVFFVGGLLMKWGVVMMSPNEGTSLDEEQKLNQSA
jgi:hypothetical protein